MSKRKGKFNNRKVGGHASIGENKRANILKAFEKEGRIFNLREQVVFELQPKYKTKDKKSVRKMEYIADFVYEKGGNTIVEDFKGCKTEVYRIKKKLFQYKYPEYIFIETNEKTLHYL